MLDKWPAVRDSHECNGLAANAGGRTAEGARQGARMQQKPRTVVVVDHVVFADAAAAHHRDKRPRYIVQDSHALATCCGFIARHARPVPMMVARFFSA